MNSLQLRTECLTRTPTPACLPVPRCYKRPGQAPSPILQAAQLRRASRHAEATRVGVIVRASAKPSSSSFPRHYKVPEQPPFWKQLAKTTLFLPALVAAALLRPAPASAAQLAWRFWKSQPAQPARQESLPQPSWQAATASRGAERWQRTLDSTSFRTAAVVLSFFSMMYAFFLAFQDAPATPVTLGKIQSYKQMLAEQQEAEQLAPVEDAPASSEILARISAYQQLLAEQQRPTVSATQPSRRSRVSEAIQQASGRSSHTPSASQSNIGLTPQQFTAGMEMPATARPVSVAARDPHRPAAVRDLPFTPAPIRSYSAPSDTITRSYAPTVPYIPSLAGSLSAAESEPESLPSSSGSSSPLDTVDIPAEDTPSAVSMGEKVKRRAQEIRDSGRLENAAPKNAKAAAEPADVDSINDEPVSEAHAASQNGAGPATKTVDLPDSHAPSTSRSAAFDTVDIPAEDTPPAAVTGQRVLERAQAIRESGRFRNAASKSAKAAAEPADLKSINVKPLIQMSASSQNGAAPASQNGADQALQNGVARVSQNGAPQASNSQPPSTSTPSENGKSAFKADSPQGAEAEQRNSKLVREMLNEVQQADDAVAKATAALREPEPALLPAQASKAAPAPARRVSADNIVRRLSTANPLGEIFDGIVGRKQAAPESKHDGALESPAARNSKYDAVSALLHSAVTEADKGAPKSGLVHDILRLGDAVSPNKAERRPAPGFLTNLLKVEETQSSVPQLGEIQSSTLQASSPIKRPSKYDPLPGFLNAEPSRSRPAMDPFAGILGLILGHSNSRAEARAKRAAESMAPAAAAATTSQAMPGRVRQQQSKATQKPVTKPAKKTSPPRIDVKIYADQVGEPVPLRKWEVRYPFSSNGAGKDGNSNGVSKNGTGNGVSKNGTGNGVSENGASNGVSENGASNGVSKNGAVNGWPVREKAAASSR